MSADDVSSSTTGEPASVQLLEILERRRLAVDASMWQIPGLAVAGQAFLLQVIANPAVPRYPALMLAIAGAAATLAAALALTRLIEVQLVLAQHVAVHAKRLGLPKFDNDSLAVARTGRIRGMLARTARVRGWLMWAAYLLVLVCFVAADFWIWTATART
jgi:hypothetical protein